jgi:hypothetical protein
VVIPVMASSKPAVNFCVGRWRLSCPKSQSTLAGFPPESNRPTASASTGTALAKTPNRQSAVSVLVASSSQRLGATAKADFLVCDGQIRAEAVIRHTTPRVGLGLKFTALVKEVRPQLAALMARPRSSSRLPLDSSNSQLTKNKDAVIDLTNELRFEEWADRRRRILQGISIRTRQATSST